MPDVIRSTQLSRAFGGRPVVRALDLSVPQGSVYAFPGPNGAGKSTTIRLLLGLLRPDSGGVNLFDLALREHRLAVLARVGSLVEMPSLYPHLTAAENLAIPARLLGRRRSDITRALDPAGDSTRRRARGGRSGAGRCSSRSRRLCSPDWSTSTRTGNPCSRFRFRSGRCTSRSWWWCTPSSARPISYWWPARWRAAWGPWYPWSLPSFAIRASAETAVDPLTFSVVGGAAAAALGAWQFARRDVQG
jgi:hypothetical protein